MAFLFGLKVLSVHDAVDFCRSFSVGPANGNRESERTSHRRGGLHVFGERDTEMSQGDTSDFPCGTL